MASNTALALPGDAPMYERHRPEQTPLYALIDEHFPQFLERLEAEGVSLALLQSPAAWLSLRDLQREVEA